MIKYYFVCDLEFTQLDPMRGQIIECAFLVTDLNYNVVNEFHAKVRPEIINDISWDPEAEKYHKISIAEAKNHPYSRREFCMELLNFLAPYYYECLEPQPFACHSIQKGFTNKFTGITSWPVIDYFFLEWAFRFENLLESFNKIVIRTKTIPTVQTAKDYGLYVMQESIDKNGKKSNRKKYKLDLLCKLIGFDLKHHEALSDAYGCLAILKYCSSEKELFNNGI